LKKFSLSLSYSLSLALAAAVMFKLLQTRRVLIPNGLFNSNMKNNQNLNGFFRDFSSWLEIITTVEKHCL
jgi:hypothetical protein